MGFIKQAKADSLAGDAERAWNEGRTIFIAQFRGGVGHTAALSRPISGVAEMLEAVEAVGWKMDQFTSVPWDNNMTIVCLFRR